MPFTHVAKYQARIAVEAILGRPRAAQYADIPRVVFGYPEAAAVGLAAEEATAEGLRVRTAEVDLTAALARPWTYERDPAGAELGRVADADRGRLLWPSASRSPSTGSSSKSRSSRPSARATSPRSASCRTT